MQMVKEPRLGFSATLMLAVVLAAGCSTTSSVSTTHTATTTAAAGGTTTAPAVPQPGLQFIGEIEPGPAMAAPGGIGFILSEDGTSVTDLFIGLMDVEVGPLKVLITVDDYSGWQAPVADGRFSSPIPAVLTAGTSDSDDLEEVLTSLPGQNNFTGPGGETEFWSYSLEVSSEVFPVVASLDTVGQLEGQILSATEAAGTITLWVWVIGTPDRACPLGTFPWSATVVGVGYPQG